MIENPLEPDTAGTMIGAIQQVIDRIALLNSIVDEYRPSLEKLSE